MVEEQGVRVHNRQEKRTLPEGFTGALEQCGDYALSLLNGPYRARFKLPELVNVSLIDDAQIRRVHAQFMDNPTPTDVITFPYGLEGEILISIETAERQALAFKASFEQEILLYLIHGLLHLAGYDDSTSTERVEMEQVQKALVDEVCQRSRGPFQG